ncbi:hypothetical protein UlMin_013034 [Ulmus minor]
MDILTFLFFFFLLFIREMAYRWVFNGKDGESKIILVEEDISLVGFVDNIYSKIGASRDTFNVSLSYLPDLNGKTSPIFIRTDEDFEIYFQDRKDRICKLPLKVIVISKSPFINEDSDEESDDADDDTGDLSLHDGGGGFHDTWFDVDYLANDQIDVGTSRTKLPVYYLYEGQYFSNKKELKNKLTKIVLKGNFEFRTRKSNSWLWLIECVDPSCSWRVRASKIAPDSVYFVIRKYVGVHSCSLLSRNSNHHQVTYAVVGKHVAQQYVGGEKGPAPKGVQTIVRTNLNTKVSYFKAWRGRQHAQSLIRGSPKESFYMLPSYCYMLEMANSGTVTRIEVDEESRFMYFFLAFGASIRGFNYMRKVIGIDGTFLKGLYKCVLLVSMAQDGNSKCYPIAWGIVDSENDDSWTWFLTRMKEVIGDIDELVFISDMAKSIKNVVSTVFNNAQHGACAWHVAQNVKNKFKCSDIMGSY